MIETQCNIVLSLTVMCSDCRDWLCRVTRDKLGPGGSQVLTAVTGHREIQGSRGKPATTAHLVLL